MAEYILSFPFRRKVNSEENLWYYITKYKNSEDFDVTIKVDKWERRCHRKMLELASPVFEAMFRWNHPDTQNAEIKLHIGKPETLDIVIDALYGHTFNINKDNFQSILEIVDFLDIEELYHECIYFIENISVTNQNCFQLCQLCSVYNFCHPDINIYIRAHLPELALEPDMLNIDEESIKAVLLDETLIYWPEESRFKFLSAWCNSSKERLKLFPELFELINIDRISKAFVNDFMKKHHMIIHDQATLARMDERIVDKENTSIPFLLLYSGKKGSLFGLDINNQHWYRIKAADFVTQVDRNVVTRQPSNLTEAGLFHSFDKYSEDNYVDCYDIHTDTRCRKMISSQDASMNKKEIVFFFEMSGRMCFAQLITKFSNRLRSTEKGTTIFTTTGDENDAIIAESVVSFPFEISKQTAANNGTDVFIYHSNKVMCYSMKRYTLTELDVSSYYRISPLLNGCLLDDFSKKLYISNGSGLSITHVEHNKLIGYMATFFEFQNTVYIIRNGQLITCKFTGDRFDFNDQKTITCPGAEQVRLTQIYHQVLAGVYLKDTHPLCHVNCPHCIPEKRDDEVDKVTHRFGYLGWEDDQHSDYDYYDDNDDYESDDAWDKKEYFFNASADEWEETWW